LDVKKRFTEEQIIGFLKQAEAGMAIKELCRERRLADASRLERPVRCHVGAECPMPRAIVLWVDDNAGQITCT